MILFTFLFIVFAFFCIRLVDEITGKRCPKHGCLIHETDGYSDKRREPEYYCPECHLKESKKGKHGK